MADEKDSPNSSVPRRSWSPVADTVLLELVGLAICGIAALVGWPFGWLPDPALVAAMAGLIAAGPAAELYRAGPRRPRAAVAALLALVTVMMLGAAATNWAVPALGDPDLGILVGFLLGMPAAVAVLVRLLGRTDVA
ncbi:hypothetical protein ABZT04_19430 [Streptomyces sp. NPDC005492]|uniref:hypothetical protein n=1 Tax=Streptomyces sp. NPDC005492 TaxID=3156883 RepID=UPI0033AA7E8D